jgi:transposase InsO family protein
MRRSSAQSVQTRLTAHRYYRSTVLDGYSRKFLAWALSATMRVTDVTETLALARAAASHKTGAQWATPLSTFATVS